jgi:hypothetical protein
MSHIVSISTRVHDPIAITAACARLGLKAPVEGTANLFSGTASGLLVRFGGWQYPAVIDTLTGTIRYDTFNGAWGDPAHLSRFLQSYAVEKTKLEARKRGHTVNEQQQADGSVRLQIVEAV